MKPSPARILCALALGFCIPAHPSTGQRHASVAAPARIAQPSAHASVAATQHPARATAPDDAAPPGWAGEFLGVAGGQGHGQLHVMGDTLVSGGGHLLRFYALGRTHRPEPQGELIVQGAISDLASDERGYVYAATVGGGLHIVDARDPSSPRKVASLFEPTNIRYVLALDHWLFVQDGSGLAVVDVTRAETPQLVTRVPLEPYLAGITLAGNRVYVGSVRELFVVDVEDPRHPFLAARLPISAQRVLAMDDFLVVMGYFADEPALAVLDLSDVTQPRTLGVVALEEGGLQWWPSDKLERIGRVVITDCDTQFCGFEISPAGVPRLLIKALYWRSQTYAAWRDKLITSDPTGLHTIDMRDPAGPYDEAFQLGCNVADVARCGQPHSLVISGTIGLVVTHTGLRTIDVAEPAHPRPLGELIVDAEGSTGAETGGASMFGHFAYLSSRDAGLVVVDLADPEHPREVRRLPMNGDLLHLAVTGAGLVASRSSDAGLIVFSLDDPDRPKHIEFDAGPGQLLAADEDRVFTLTSDEDTTQLHLLSGDRRSPMSPVSTIELPLGENPKISDAFLRGDRLYLAARLAGVAVIAVPRDQAPRYLGALRVPALDSVFTVAASDDGLLVTGTGRGAWVELGAWPTSTIQIHTFDLQVGSWETDSAIAGTTGYVAGAGGMPGGIWTIALGDSGVVGPYGALSLEPSWSAHSFDVDRGLAAVCGSGGSLHLIDVHQPDALRQLGELPIENQGCQVKLVGDVAYDLADELWVVDVSSPAMPHIVGSATLPSWGTWRRLAVGDGLLVLSGDDGLGVYDISRPLSPTLVASVEQRAKDAWQQLVALDNRRAYLYRQGDGLRLYDLSDPSHPVAGAHLQESLDVMVAQTGRLWLFGGSGAEVLDTTDLMTPRQIAFLPDVGGYAAEVAGSTLLVSPHEHPNGHYGVNIYDVSVLAHPRLLGRLPTYRDASAIQKHGDTIYLASGGFQVFRSLVEDGRGRWPWSALLPAAWR